MTGFPKKRFFPRPEDMLGVVGHVFSHHAPRGFGHFAGQRFGGDDGIGWLFLRVVEAAAGFGMAGQWKCASRRFNWN